MTRQVRLSQTRVSKLQELYMRDMEQSASAQTVHQNIHQHHLLQLATPELLAISQPHADFAPPGFGRSTHIVPALHEIQALSRERSSLKEQVCSSACTAAHCQPFTASLA